MSESDDLRLERASELLERLMTDTEFRARFRERPAAACREAGFSEIADEIASTGGAMQTLDVRESRSSLLGVLMAAALEGMGVAELAHYASSSGLAGDAANVAQRALTKAGLRAVHPGAGLHGPHLPHAPHVQQPHLPHVQQPHVPHVQQPHVPHPHVPHTPGQAASAAAAGFPDSGSGSGGSGAASGASPGGAAAAGAGAGAAAGADPNSAAAGAGAGQAAAASPGSGAASGVADPSAAAAPAGGAGAGAHVISGGGVDTGAVGGSGDVGASAAAVTPGGGAGSAAVDALLQNPQVSIPPAGQAALVSGQADHRIAPLLETLASKHKLGLRTVSGGTVEIVTVDGRPVTPTNTGARELMSEIADVDPSSRPSQVAGPWPISGFASGAAHENHIQLSFGGGGAPSAAPAAAQASPFADPSGGGTPGAASPFASGSAPGGSHGTIQFGAVQDPSAQPAPVHAAAASVDQPAGGGGHGADAAAAAADTAPSGGGFDPVAASQDYPGDRASKAQIAAWMGRWAERAGLPRQLPVMASLVESGMSNVQYGDADSLGFFQMRTSVWSGQYPDFQHHPGQQLKWFIDQALAVKQQRLASGQTAFQHDPNQFGDWIADIERPAEQYRGRYQLRLDQADGLLGQSAAAPAPPPVVASAASAPASPVAAPLPAAPPPPAVAGAGAAGGGVGQPAHGTISFTAAAPDQSAGGGAGADPSAAGAGAPAAGAAAAAAPGIDPATGAPLHVPGEQVTAPGTAPDELRKIFERAAELDQRHLPYVYGGGHQVAGVIDVNSTGPVDCSATVSAVLGIDTRVSGAYETYGEAGPGKYVTIYSNPEHVLMEINGHFFGTSAANPGGGAGWIPREHIDTSYLAGFVARHPPGM